MTDIHLFGRTRTGRPFIKMHGLLNHFVIVDARESPYAPATDEVVRICDVRTGVGGDQLVVIEPPRAEGSSAFMRILNVDGREVEACGNATRCVAWLLLEESATDEVSVDTLAGLIHCRRTGPREVACTMGRLTMDWSKVPLSHEVDTLRVDLDAGPLSDGVAVAIGNPHIVFFVDDLDEIDIELLAPVIQKNALFPNEVNVGVAQLVSASHLRSAVYERGAGLTTACGSGACAAHFAALARGLTDEREVTVSMPAGDVRIAIDNAGVATMTGPVACCFSGVI
jgi:diaminopimelate epimerase